MIFVFQMGPGPMRRAFPLPPPRIPYPFDRPFNPRGPPMANFRDAPGPARSGRNVPRVRSVTPVDYFFYIESCRVSCIGF